MNLPETLDLAQWHAALDDHERRMDMPHVYLATLLAYADELLRRGRIDELERFELAELARAAHDHAVEERLSDYLQPNGEYDLLELDGTRVGYLNGKRLYFLAEEGNHRYQAVRGAECYRILDGLMDCSIGTVTGRDVRLVSGEHYRLRQTAVHLKGVCYRALTDPEEYRLALDLRQIAVESGDRRRAADLATRLAISPFTPCPACLDWDDECPACSGLGFVSTD